MNKFTLTVHVPDEDADEFQFAFEKWFEENGFSFAIVREPLLEGEDNDHT